MTSTCSYVLALRSLGLGILTCVKAFSLKLAFEHGVDMQPFIFISFVNSRQAFMNSRHASRSHNSHVCFFPPFLYRMEIEVVYYERVDGVLQKVAELMLYANDAPLSQVFNEELPEVLFLYH